MPPRALTGSRIRERRNDLSLRQAELARRVEISASYLNLIEHNRRRIGGSLIVAIARELGVDPAALTEGAQTELLESLRDAAAAQPEIDVETTRTDDLAGRFPGWAALVAAQHQRIGTLERTVEALTDRLTHDPYLSASLHEVLSTVTAIRSTAGILVNGGDLDPEWLARFHRNLYDDSQRLAQGSQALASYLEDEEVNEASATAPHEELEAWLSVHGHYFEALEKPATDAKIKGLVADAEQLTSTPARALATSWLRRYEEDARAIPQEDLIAQLENQPLDPAALAAHFNTGLGRVLRRLATMQKGRTDLDEVGLVLCDGSGALTFRKQIDGFAQPRFGAACPLWPIYQALTRPMVPIRAVVTTASRTPLRFQCFAVCEPVGKMSFDAPPVYEATMLILPAPQSAEAASEAVQPIGSSCRICPRQSCAARREPSILSEGF